jgi:pimeloyl-ACP methyl ester carboxylesterase
MSPAATEANQSGQTGGFSSLPQRELELSAGTVRYREAGAGEPILFVHGLLVDGRLWHGVADRLSDRFRCLVPDWPIGSQVLPMRSEADLSPPALSLLIAEFIDKLGLQAVTVVGNDSGGAISQMLVERRSDAVGRLVLTNCDIDDNFPPFPFNAMPPLARVPGGTAAIVVPLRLRALRRLIYGWLAQNPIPDDLVKSWLVPSWTNRRVRQNLTATLTAVQKQDLVSASANLRSFEGPVLFAWGSSDRFFPITDARRLAATMPDARVVEISDAKTFVALDQPQRLAEAIGAFIAP